jgi:hypothetical protein
MRFSFQFVLERLQGRDLIDAVAECLREQPVSEPRISREERPVEIRPDGATNAAAFPAALAVVAEAGDNAAERLGAFVEARPAGMVLESRQRPALTGLELALQQHVADHPRIPCDRLVREEPDAW